MLAAATRQTKLDSKLDKTVYPRIDAGSLQDLRFNVKGIVRAEDRGNSRAEVEQRSFRTRGIEWVIISLTCCNKWSCQHRIKGLEVIARAKYN